MLVHQIFLVAWVPRKLLEKQRKDYEVKLDYLTEVKRVKGKSAAIFKLKDKIVGSKKEGMESVSMNDPISGDMICDPEELKRVSVAYFSNLLTKDEYKQNLHILKLLHEHRMTEDCVDEEDLR